MARPDLPLTGVERFFPESEIIVSKTDPTGRLTYVNDVFIEVGGYAEAELIGKPHSIIRHPAMPRCVFRLLWQSIQAGREIFAYVVNRAKNGDHYWVLAHVTPTFDAAGAVVGFHSNRRVPRREAVAAVTPLYQELVRTEAAPADRRAGVEAGLAHLQVGLRAKEMSYDRFVLSL